MATVSKSIAVSAQGVYTVELNVIPNGSTVTPVNDIQTWLHCVNIWDKNYTTINQVLADSTTLLALISSNNAVDYMARSTSWASSVCANQTAMGYIGNNDYCANKLLADSTWRSSICNSTYFEAVLKKKIPTMTSATAPSGQVTASSYYDANYAPYKAFDGNVTNTGWAGATGTENVNPWCQYMFPDSGIVANKVGFYEISSLSSSSTKTYKLQGSNNGSNWTDLKKTTLTQGNAWVYVDFANTIKYKYYRWQFVKSESTMVQNNGNGSDFQVWGR